MLNQYETVFILTPILSEAQVKETVTKFKDLIESHGGTMVHEEQWGLRKLAYPIKRKTSGYYTLLEFRAEGSFIERLETNFIRDERVLRFLTFRMDKYAIEYAEKRRQRPEEEETEATDVRSKSEI